MKHTALPPTTLVIFGVSGNLAQRKLLPALYHLAHANLLPDKFAIVAIFQETPDVESIFQQAEIQILRDHQECDTNVLQDLRKKVRPIHMDSTKPEDFIPLRDLLEEIDRNEQETFNHLFYLAIPPQIFMNVVSNLSSVGLNKSPLDKKRESRILAEKPFGNDLKSAQDLITQMFQHFEEHQIYRIDHYLAKETAQNILAFRFNNPLIEGIWSRQFIDHIQITASESIDIQGRVSFYEGIGALRDIVQSHLMQLMALVMMEYPQGITSHAIHQEKLLLLNSLEPIAPNHVDEVAVRGQYQGYLEEVQNPHSKMETFAALKLEVANTRWGGVPILLRTGKALTEKTTEITVVFKDRMRRTIADNILIMRIQPNEGISLKLMAKKPGFNDDLQPVQMDFCYEGTFNDSQPDAYQRVLEDAMRGDQTLFATSDEVLASWRLLQPVLDSWKANPAGPEVYERGSWGPANSNSLAANFGCEWLNNQIHVCPIHPTTEVQNE